MPRVAGRSPLTKAQIVEKAVALMDAHGVEAVSMRRLAAELEVRPMALYYYVADREALLGEVIEAVLAECVGPAEGPWRERLAALCWAYRRVAQRHPAVFLAAMAYHTNVPSDYVIAEDFLAILTEAQLPPQLTVRSYNLLLTYVSGFAVDEVRGALLAFDATESFADANREQFPQLQAHRAYLTTLDLDAEFTYGLTTLIAGIAPCEP